MHAPSRLTDIYFTGNDTGYIPGGSNALFKTTDGGHTWAQVTPITGFNIVMSGSYIPFFINDGAGWVSDGHGIFYSNGSVNSWAASSGVPTSSTGLMPIFALNADIVYTAIAGANPLRLYKSTDGGIHFSQAATINAKAGYPDIYFTDTNTGWICGAREIFATTDGGLTWAPVVSLGQTSPIEIHFTDSNHGWACCGDGSILIFRR
jgi:photosystem II stability/assembly factor-like uncharacterized protein